MIVLQAAVQLLINNVIVFRHVTLFADDVYMDTQPLIRSVMDGYNVCIFAYGQTGSGKTHTMVRTCKCSFCRSNLCARSPTRLLDDLLISVHFPHW